MKFFRPEPSHNEFLREPGELCLPGFAAAALRSLDENVDVEYLWLENLGTVASFRTSFSIISLLSSSFRTADMLFGFGNGVGITFPLLAGGSGLLGSQQLKRLYFPASSQDD